MNYRVIHAVDLVTVHLMAFKVLEKDMWFFEQLFTPTEISYCQKKEGHTNQALSFAARQAAKGAVGKILGMSSKLGWERFKDIEVVNNDIGRPEIRLHGKAKELALEMGLNFEDISLTISHTNELAIASAAALVKKRKEGKTKMGKVRVIDAEAKVRVIDAEANVERNNLESLFAAIADAAGLSMEVRREYVNYRDTRVIVFFAKDPQQVVARHEIQGDEFVKRPSRLVIQFYSKQRDLLDGFVRAAKTAAEDYDIDIDIKVV